MKEGKIITIPIRILSIAYKNGRDAIHGVSVKKIDTPLIKKRRHAWRLCQKDRYAINKKKTPCMASLHHIIMIFILL